MNQKTLRNLLIVFAILLLAAVVPSVVNHYQLWPRQKVKSDLQLKSLSVDQITDFAIRQPQQYLQFSKQEGEWQLRLEASPSAQAQPTNQAQHKQEQSPQSDVKIYQASQQQVSQLLQAVQDLEVQRLASKNPDYHAKYGLTDDQQHQLQLVDDYQLLLGESGPSLNTFYVKKPDSSHLYLAAGALRNLVTQDVDQWRQKQILSLTPQAVEKVEVSRDGETLVLAQDGDNHWAREGGGSSDNLSTEEVQQSLGQILPLTVQGFLDQDQQQQLEAKQPEVTITITPLHDQDRYQLDLVKQQAVWWGRFQPQAAQAQSGTKQVDTEQSGLEETQSEPIYFTLSQSLLQALLDL